MGPYESDPGIETESTRVIHQAIRFRRLFLPTPNASVTMGSGIDQIANSPVSNAKACSSGTCWTAHKWAEKTTAVLVLFCMNHQRHHANGNNQAWF